MKISIYKYAKGLGFLLVGLLLFSSFIVTAYAQTTKKKKVHRTKPVAASQNTLPSSEPIIMSRASDYQEDNVAANTATTQIEPNAAETERDHQLAAMSERIRQLESGMKNGYDEKQKRLLLNLDILTKAEQRSESLRKQRFELVEKESTIRTRLDQIESDIRPETIERGVALMGTLRPEELREARRKSLDTERRNLQSLLVEVQANRAALEQTVVKADQLVEKLRTKMESDIDKALDDDSKDN